MALGIDKLKQFAGRFVGDLGATAGAAKVIIESRRGLYKALAVGPASGGTVQPRIRGAAVTRMVTPAVVLLAAGALVGLGPGTATASTCVSWTGSGQRIRAARAMH